MEGENYMPSPSQYNELIQDIQHNCNISDARDHGIYSMCTMVLRLRNLYKWEKEIQPWEEPESADLLDWIEDKENYWATIAAEPFRNLSTGGQELTPEDIGPVNCYLNGRQVIYGAGYGRSLKAIFFLAAKLEERRVENCPVFILGHELAKEMSSPFAMLQDGVIIIRKDPLRFFLWDHIQELRSTCRPSFHHALQSHGVLKNGQLDQELLKERLDVMVEEEMNLFIYHEVGEMLQTTLDSATLQRVIGRFPGSIFELVCRAVKDTLADTHPQGPLAYIIRERRESSLSLYLGFIDGLRKQLIPEIVDCWQHVVDNKDWSHIEQVRNACRQRQLRLAKTIRDIAAMIDHHDDEQVQYQFKHRVLMPLGLEQP